MDIERAVDDFVAKGRELFHRLRSEGETLSDCGLKLFQNQLHILTVEGYRLKHLKLSTGRRKANPIWLEQSPGAHSVQKTQLNCSHNRLIDDVVDAKGERTNLVCCLECGAIIKELYLKPE